MWVQSALNQVANLRLPVDGIMGPATRSAIRDFQQKEGLLVDGIAGPQTRDALIRAQGAIASSAQPSSPPTSNGAAAPPAEGEPAQAEFYGREMYEDELTEEEWEDDEWEDEVNRSSRDYIRWAQRSLNSVMGLNLAVDGIVGPMTASATRSFQQKFGLTVDGIVGPQTEAMLISVTATTPPQAPSGGSGAYPAVNTPLPSSGDGFYNKHGSNTRSYGLRETIQALIAVGQAWKRKYPSGPRIGMGDISFKGGGPMDPHKSHQKGVDIDIRLPRNDGVEAGTNFRDPSYSRSRTQDLVNMIKANGVLRVEFVLFNDPNVSGVKYSSGHDDHLHVRFYAP
jgi:peptidoglycan hydrolase-like protein with peptidoglycan-binding domain